MDATEGKEIKRGIRERSTGKRIRRDGWDGPRRNAVGSQFAFDGHDQPVPFASHMWGQVKLKRQVTAFVPPELNAIQPDLGQVIDRTEPDPDMLEGGIPPPRQIKSSLIPGMAQVIAHIFELVIPTRRDSRRASITEAVWQPRRCARACRIETQVPES